MDPWVWAVLLLLLGLSLVVLEIFVPSGGLIGFLAACAIIAAVVLAFLEENKAIGIGVLAAAVVGLPTVAAVALHMLPETPMGRRIILQPPNSEEVLPDVAERESLQMMIGQIGRAKTMMLPGGIVSIDHRSYDAISEGMPVEEGQHVRVTEVRGGRLVVEGIAGSSAHGANDSRLAQEVDWDNLDSLPAPPA